MPFLYTTVEQSMREMRPGLALLALALVGLRLTAAEQAAQCTLEPAGPLRWSRIDIIDGASLDDGTSEADALTQCCQLCSETDGCVKWCAARALSRFCSALYAALIAQHVRRSLHAPCTSSIALSWPWAALGNPPGASHPSAGHLVAALAAWRRLCGQQCSLKSCLFGGSGP